MRKKLLLAIGLGAAASTLADSTAPGLAPSPPAGSESNATRIGCSSQYQGKRDRSCGAAALADLLTYHYGDALTPRAVFAELWDQSDEESRKNGFSLLDIKRFLARHGYESDGFDSNLDELAAIGLPAIVIVKLGGSSQFVIIKGINDQSVLVGDPAFGVVKMSRDRFNEIWRNRIAFVIRNDDRLVAPLGGHEQDWLAAHAEAEYFPKPSETTAGGAPPVQEPVAPPAEIPQEPAPPTGLAGTLGEIGAGFKATARVQSFVSHSDYATGQPINYGNAFAKLPTTELNTEFRPLLSLDYGPLQLVAKPRLRLQWDHADFKPRGQAETDDDFQASVFLIEGWARVALWDRLFLQFGREALLWGPAMFITPSNPFFISNNRSNPYREIRGRDYAKATYLINDEWTASFISNVGLGLDVNTDPNGFQRTDAVKLDYTGISINSALVASRRDDGLARLGGYFQWTLTDALLLYLDGQLSFGGDSLYARQVGGPPGWAWEKSKGSSLQGLGLIGGSYTFEIGPTLSVEYVYNSAGYSEPEARNYNGLTSDLSNSLRSGVPGPAGALLSQAQLPGLSLLRRNYLFFQLLESNLFDSVDITIRYTQNLDDGGSELVPIIDWSVGDSTHLFALSAINFGGRNTEARRFLENQVFFGFNYTFSP